MRVIAGRLGGRSFDSPGTHRTHPMSDKMRGALFNILGDIEGLSALDVFAGTGALAFEALSRGAGQAVLCENDRTAQQTVERNIRSLGLTKHAQLVKASANAWLQINPTVVFDLVLCDPPYDNLQESLIVRLTACVRSDGLLVLSWPGDVALPTLPGFACIEQRSYGDGQLAFYRRIR
ncbi:MAG TPA: 16S rRNA (guanine(966)-N(2))-methyltransferase RsmD [Candidatus Saccharimonadales bacterium]|nr:16S rRNA (guanine(966)-N(2))-methyltransferase RsmD [Candidatus Saccharimonadales bacterium]